MIDGYIGIARKLSNQFDTILAKELFSSFVLKCFEVHLIVSMGVADAKSYFKLDSTFYTFNKRIKYLFEDETLYLSFDYL